MPVEYTQEQMSIVNYKEDELLVRGVAGSGKTLALVANAMMKSEESVKILFITYNKTLTQKINSIWNDFDKNYIEIKNFHKWAWSEYARILGRPGNSLWEGEKKKFIRNIINDFKGNYDSRFLELSEDNIEFLAAEFDFIKGKNIRNCEDYMNVSRIGRGNKIRLVTGSPDRKIIFELFKEFEEIKKSYNKFEFIDFGYELYEYNNQVTRYDYVYIDEAQDLNQVELQLLRKIADKGFYVCADDGQKIYKTCYTWSEVGANFRGGRTKKLSISFRSTYEIFKFANEMQKNDTSNERENYIIPEFIKENSGIQPAIIECKNSRRRDLILLDKVENYIEQRPDNKIGILCQDRNLAQYIYDLLDSEKINCYLQKRSAEIDFSKNVLITTLHSSKGLEFDYVIIPQFNDEPYRISEETEEEYLNKRRKIWYVAFTRARNNLDIMYFGNPNVLLNEIDVNLYRKYSN